MGQAGAAKGRFSPAWRCLAVGLYVALACVRIPDLVSHPRLWAEEGTIYFANAWNLPWWEALLKPAVGYLNLAANSAGILACITMPLERVPDATLAVALALQTIPAVLLATARDAWLRRPAVLFAAILLLAMPPVSDEVWLNTPNSQFHLALAAALCLVLDVPTGAGAAARALLLFFAPLSSPASIALTPLFAARAAMDGERGRWRQAICITAGTLLQLIFFYTSLPGRGHFLGPAILASVLAVKHLAIPLLGEQAAAMLAARLHQQILAAHYPVAVMLGVVAAFGLLLAAVVVQRRPQPAWLLASAAALAGLSYYGALGGGIGLIDAIGANRYAFAPAMLLALTVLCLATGRLGRSTVAAQCVIVWLLAIATQQTVLPQDSVFTKGPRWPDEIRSWRLDQNHPVQIWPEGWSVRLGAHAGRG